MARSQVLKIAAWSATVSILGYFGMIFGLAPSYGWHTQLPGWTTPIFISLLSVFVGSIAVVLVVAFPRRSR